MKLILASLAILASFVGGYLVSDGQWEARWTHAEYTHGIDMELVKRDMTLHYLKTNGVVMAPLTIANSTNIIFDHLMIVHLGSGYVASISSNTDVSISIKNDVNWNMKRK